jgi:hypothetical protein
LTKRPGRGGIEWERIKAGLGHLEPSLSNCSFPLVIGYKGTHRQLGERDSGDVWLLR